MGLDQNIPTNPKIFFSAKNFSFFKFDQLYKFFLIFSSLHKKRGKCSVIKMVEKKVIKSQIEIESPLVKQQERNLNQNLFLCILHQKPFEGHSDEKNIFWCTYWLWKKFKTWWWFQVKSWLLYTIFWTCLIPRYTKYLVKHLSQLIVFNVCCLLLDLLVKLLAYSDK